MEAARDTGLREISDQMWRLHNLYTIINKQGKQIPFRPNWAQTQFYEEFTNRHLVPKGRQFGLSTGIQILMLDCCIFTPFFSAVTIAHELDPAEKMFFRNIKFPYDNLAVGIREMVSASRDRSKELRFSNGSSVSVVTSARSGAYNFIHVSEFGKICKKYPDKAREIVTGTFEAAATDQIIVIESTSESGEYGEWYDYCTEAKKNQDEGNKITELDWRLTFLPWWKHPEYVLPPANVLIDKELKKYFDQIKAEHGIDLKPARKAWYAKKRKTLGDRIKQEYPSFLEESFQTSTKGAYYTEQMTKIRLDGRITDVPYQSGVLVDTYWDLGIDDEMAIWLVQSVGKEKHVIRYIEDNDYGLEHYIRILRKLGEEEGYIYGTHYGPHDLQVRELGPGVSRKESAKRMGLNFTLVPRGEVADGIDAVRNALSIYWFDREKCKEGIKHLDSYRKEWNERKGTFKDRPLHDKASNAADAFRTGVVGEILYRKMPAIGVSESCNYYYG